MNITERKKKIIQWVDSKEDLSTLELLERFSKEQPFGFEKEIQNAVTADELKKRTTEFLRKLDWTK